MGHLSVHSSNKRKQKQFAKSVYQLQCANTFVIKAPNVCKFRFRYFKVQMMNIIMNVLDEYT